MPDWNPHRERAHIVQPLAHVEPDDVHQRGRAQGQQRKDNIESRVAGEMLPGRLPHEEHIAGGEVQDGREVGEIARPVRPRGHEPGEVAKGALAPHIESALVRIARGEFQHRKRQRRVEAQPGPNPDDDRTRARGRRRRNPAQADAGDYIKQQQVAEPHNVPGVIGVFGLRGGDAGREKGDVVRLPVRIGFGQWRVPGSGYREREQEK